MQILKQSTAVDVLIGPFVDAGDGTTPEEGESPAVLLSKNGQGLAAKNDATTPVHDDAGYYNCELDATDTNTVGTLVLVVESGATHLAVRHEFQIVEENVYDAIFGASAALGTDVASILTDTAEIGAAGAGLTVLATQASVDALENISAADVNAQVLDVLNTDTFAEPTGVPAATATLVAKLGYLYMALRNKITVTATKKTFFDDGDAAEWEKDLSDDGTTYTESEGNSI